MKQIKVVVAFSLISLVAACGGVRSTVVRELPDGVTTKQVQLGTTEVVSSEQGDRADKLNQNLRRMVHDQLVRVLTEKGIETSSGAPNVVASKVEVTYGSRGARIASAGLSGGGYIRVSIELRDSSGAVMYATETDGELHGGTWGGSMDKIIAKASRAAAREFGSHL